jgi:DUF917 family protein
MHALQKEDFDAFLEGVAILGTGGGGSPEWGRVILEHDLHQGRSAEIVQPEDVPDDALVASGGIMGSVKVLDKIDPHNLVQTEVVNSLRKLVKNEQPKKFDNVFELVEEVNKWKKELGPIR